MKGPTGKTVFRSEYKPYPWILNGARFNFCIEEHETVVRSRIEFSRKPDSRPDCPIELDGQDMTLRSVHLDGKALSHGQFELTPDKLIITNVPDECTLELCNAIRPRENTALEGLYPSGEFLLTQCEAEGFRKITYFPDRPDVMTLYEVTVEADKQRYPVLLSNGNAVAKGEDDNGRHWVRWNDPFRKPSYLFALVAGDLAHVEDHFTTRSGRDVTLRIYVEKENIGRCEHAMESLKNAMKWDEDRFGLEYDLDIYNIVATNDFNMGAMENKSLNIFNARNVLASPETATDIDYQLIEGVIGHEYFHNWTGNRVTCRDWFQLTLKEGLTVFRDQEFSSDMQSRAVKRIQDVRDLRNRQFPEDAGPMAHPIRPDQYIEINNFYTMTVYQKGAAIIRMVHMLLGEEKFQAGMKLYIERHDGQAVTCDDFIAAMADASGVDLENFSRWYSQSGTPEVIARGEYDPDSGEYRLHLSQRTPQTDNQQERRPLTIPFEVGLLDKQGREMNIRLAGETEKGAAGTRVLVFDQERQTFTFEGVESTPVPSLLRRFSAPVKLEFDYSDDDLALLMACDTDTFVRWEAAQLLARKAIFAQRQRREDGQQMKLPTALRDAVSSMLGDLDSDPALLGEALALPSEEYLADFMETVDVDGIHEAREFIRRSLAESLRAQFLQRYQALESQVYSKSPEAIGRRRLRNVCLSYLASNEDGSELAESQLSGSDNMTDTLAALRALVMNEATGAAAALEDFEARWRDDSLVMDKWFAIQAARPSPDTVRHLPGLMEHPAFSITNPNKVRAVIGVFSLTNPTGFHAKDGSGYRFLADQVIALNALNPQIAARLVSAFNAWRRYDPARRKKIESQLRRIAAEEALSPDVYEIVTNALKPDR